MNKKFFPALNGLRFFLFLLIIATHYKYIINVTPIGHKLYPFLNQGHFAVLFFFILSGFCISIGYEDKFEKLNKYNVLTFIKKRMLKIYPLYLITGLIMLVFYYIPHNLDWLYAYIFLYIPMLSPFTPWQDGGGNGAGWFIATLFFCYLCTPFIFNKLKSNRALFMLLLCYILSFVIAILPIFIPYLQNHSSFLYKFPPIRMIHYFFGLFLGMFYKLYFLKIKNIFLKFKSQNLLALIILLLLFFIMFAFRHGDISNPIVGIPIISIAIFYFCITESGFLYKLLTNKFSQFLGNISFECYMIHYPICIFLSRKVEPYCDSVLNIIIIYMLLLISTIVTSIFYRFLITRFKLYKNYKTNIS